MATILIVFPFATLLIADFLIDLLLLVHRETSRTDVDKQQETTDDGQGLEEVVLEEVPLRVSSVDTPPIVNEDVEDAQKSDKETGAPLGLEADGDHDTGAQTNDGDDDTGERPVALEDETNEKEDEEDSAGKLEVLASVSLAQSGQASEELLVLLQRVGENHEKSSNNTKIAKEERKVEKETVTNALRSNHSEKAKDRVFGVSLGDDSERTRKHGHDVDQEEQVGNAPREVSMFLKVPQLVTPLSKDSQSVFKERDHNEEPGQGRHIWSDRLGVSLNHIFHLATPFLDICKHLIVAEPLGLGWPGDGVRGVPAADAAPHRRLTRDVGVEVNALGHACGCLLGYGQIGYLGRVKGTMERMMIWIWMWMK